MMIFSAYLFFQLIFFILIMKKRPDLNFLKPNLIIYRCLHLYLFILFFFQSLFLAVFLLYCAAFLFWHIRSLSSSPIGTWRVRRTSGHRLDARWLRHPRHPFPNTITLSPPLVLSCPGPPISFPPIISLPPFFLIALPALSLCLSPCLISYIGSSSPCMPPSSTLSFWLSYTHMSFFFCISLIFRCCCWWCWLLTVNIGKANIFFF